MNVSLTLQQTLATFEKYNLAIWPMHVFAFLLGIVFIIYAMIGCPLVGYFLDHNIRRSPNQQHEEGQL